MVPCCERRVSHPLHSPNVSSVRLLLILNQIKCHSAGPGTSPSCFTSSDAFVFFYFRFCWLMCGICMFYLLWFNMLADWRFGLEVRLCILHGIRSVRTDVLSRVFMLPPMGPVLGLDLGLAPDPLQP